MNSVANRCLQSHKLIIVIYNSNDNNVGTRRYYIFTLENVDLLTETYWFKNKLKVDYSLDPPYAYRIIKITNIYSLTR